jgi:hypothetical protein
MPIEPFRAVTQNDSSACDFLLVIHMHQFEHGDERLARSRARRFTDLPQNLVESIILASHPALCQQQTTNTF